MKTKVLVVIFAAMAVLTGCTAKSNPLKKLAHIDNVHHVHVPNWLLALGGNGALDDDDLKGLNVSSVRDLHVYGADGSRAATALYDSVRRIVKEENYELLLKANDGDDHADIYLKQDGSRVRLIIVGRDSSDAGIVTLSAKMDKEAMGKMLMDNED